MTWASHAVLVTFYSVPKLAALLQISVKSLISDYFYTKFETVIETIILNLY